MNEKHQRQLGLGLLTAAIGLLVATGFVSALPALDPGAAGAQASGSGGSGTWFPTPIHHVVTILLENEEASSVFEAGPYETYLAEHYTYTAEDYAVCHPSEPNYLALTGGSTFGRCGTDAYTVIDNESIADLIQLRGLSWGEFAESMPVPCDTHNAYPYMVKHNPFVFYQDIVNNSARCDSHVVNFTAWNADVAANTVPNYAFITPNMLNDGHDTSVSYADAWLSGWLAPLLKQPFAKSTLFIVTYDEGATNNGYSVGNTSLWGGQIFTVFVSPYTRDGGLYAPPVSHYNVLTTTEWLLGIGSLGNNDSVVDFPPMITAFHFPGAGTITTASPEEIGVAPTANRSAR